MSARSEPLDIFWPKLRDSFSRNPALVATPCGKCLVSPPKVRKVNVRRDSPPNNEILRVAVNHMEVTVSPLDFNRLCDQDFSRKRTPHCPPLHSLPTVPERIWSGTRFLNNGNTRLCKTVYINRYIRRPGIFFRPTVELIIRCSSGIVNPPVPANDNTGPSEAEAA